MDPLTLIYTINIENTNGDLLMMITLFFKKTL